jgi:hypothetical protein
MLLIKMDPDRSLLPNNPSSTRISNISQINVKEVLSKIDLISLAEEYGLDLEPQTNGDYIAFCPFHDDKETKSLRFYTNTGTFHCFGCHAGSSAFEFVMKIEGIEFKDALFKLAGRIGYNNQFDLRDIYLPDKVKDDVRNTRENIEKISIQKAREVFFNLKNTGLVPLKLLYYHFENLWKSYDKNQRIFDKKQFNLEFSEGYEVILYRMYGAFIQKLNELEKELNPFK